MSVKVFLKSQGHLLYNLSSQRRERLPLPMAAPPYHSLILSSLLVFTVVLTHLHTFASTMWQSRYSPQSFRENPEKNGVNRYLLIIEL